jgi:hypothetical protein
MADLVIVNAGQHCWGVEREKLFAALKQLGWRKRLDRWYAPLKSRAKPITAARQLYKAAPPAPGMDIPDLDPLAEATGTDEQEWNDEYGRYPEFRIAPDLGRGVWLMCAPIRRR